VPFIKKTTVEYLPTEGNDSPLTFHVGEDAVTITDVWAYPDDRGNQPQITVQFSRIPFLTEVLDDIIRGDN